MTADGDEGGADEQAVLMAAHAYEEALAAGDNQLATSFFDTDPRTTRFGPDGSQLDLAEVQRLRASSAPVPTAVWLWEQARSLAPDVVLHLAVLRRGGSTIQRTQIWVRRGPDWRIAHAHVSNPAVDE